MNNKTIFILVLGTFFPLIGILITINPIDENTVSVQTISPDIISEYRGKDYQDITYSNGQHVWTGGLEEWIYNEKNRTYVREKITDDGIIIKIDSKQFPYAFDRVTCSGKLYKNDKSLSENPDVLIGKDTWTLNYKQISDLIWTEADLSSFTCNASISTNSSGWFLTVLREKPNVASFEIIYAKRENQPLETFSIITNNNPTWDGYHFTTNNKLENVTAEKFFIDGKEATPSNLFTSSEINSNIIQFDSGSDKFILDITKAKNQFSSVRKVGNNDFVLEFENNPAILKLGQKAIIDPTYGYSSATHKRVYHNGASGSSCPTTGAATIDTNYYFMAGKAASSNAGAGACMFSVPRWDISSIPNNSDITDVKIRYDIQNVSSPENCDWNEMNNDPTSANAMTVYLDGLNDGGGITFLNGDTLCTTVGNDKIIDLGPIADADVEAQLSFDWWAVATPHYNKTRDSVAHESNSDNSGTYLIELQITYAEPSSGSTGKSFVLVATADLSKQKNNLGTTYADIYNGSFEPDFNLINFTGYSKVRILSGWDYSSADTGNQQMRWVDANNNTRVLHETSSFTVDQDPNDSGWINLPTWAKNETTIEWQGKSTVSADDPIAKYFRIFLR